MIDVMFFLLVTFVLASLSMQALNSLTVNLPQGDAPNLQHKERVTLTITKDSHIFVDKTPVTLENMAFALKPLLHGDAGMVVNADSAAPPRDGRAGDAAGAARRCRTFPDRSEAGMSGATLTASPYLDETWWRMAWIAPLAVVVWVILLTGLPCCLSKPHRSRSSSNRWRRDS
jgi:hypothetical protein